MDFVLGLSVTSKAIRFVLVEGADGDGATVDSGALDFATADQSAMKSLVEAVLGQGPYAAVPGVRPIAVGVTWSPAAQAAAATLLQALTDKGAHNVVALSVSEAAAALATGISDLAREDEIAVCVAEPDLTLVTVVTADSVIVDPVTGTDPGSIADAVRLALETTGARPDAVYALGSAEDLPLVVAALGQPISAAEADLALARGAALASARGFAGIDARLALAAGADDPRRSWMTWRVPALTSVLATAIVTFVVSLSVALGMQLTDETRSESARTEQLAASGRLAKEPAAAVPPAAPEAAPRAPEPAAPPPPPPAAPPPPPEAVPAPAPEVAPVSEPVVEAPPPVYEAPPEPVYVPPAPEYVAPAPVAPPPAPVYVPPATAGTPPGYVPPVVPQPRLRDRLIERIPIINRFHEPQYTTP